MTDAERGGRWGPLGGCMCRYVFKLLNSPVSW